MREHPGPCPASRAGARLQRGHEGLNFIHQPLSIDRRRGPSRPCPSPATADHEAIGRPRPIRRRGPDAKCGRGKIMSCHAIKLHVSSLGPSHITSPHAHRTTYTHGLCNLRFCNPSASATLPLPLPPTTHTAIKTTATTEANAYAHTFATGPLDPSATVIQSGSHSAAPTAAAAAAASACRARHEGARVGGSQIGRRTDVAAIYVRRGPRPPCSLHTMHASARTCARFQPRYKHRIPCVCSVRIVACPTTKRVQCVCSVRIVVCPTTKYEDSCAGVHRRGCRDGAAQEAHMRSDRNAAPAVRPPDRQTKREKEREKERERPVQPQGSQRRY